MTMLLLIARHLLRWMFLALVLFALADGHTEQLIATVAAIVWYQFVCTEAYNHYSIVLRIRSDNIHLRAVLPTILAVARAQGVHNAENTVAERNKGASSRGLALPESQGEWDSAPTVQGTLHRLEEYWAEAYGDPNRLNRRMLIVLAFVIIEGATILLSVGRLVVG